jgi:GT2 family glycosyltransferase
MESRAPAVVAVVVTTGPGPDLEATLASLVAQDYAELSLLVVANAEGEHVAARVAAVAPSAFVRVLDENRGFGAACNEASLMVEGSAFFLFCHDDVRLESDAVQKMVEAAYRANAGIVTPKFVSYEDPLVLLHVGQTCDRFGVTQERVQPGEIDHGQQDLERDVFVAPGGVTLVRSDLFGTLQGFDPLILALGEDLDLCWRAQVAGARVVVAPSAKVAHRESIARGERAVTAVGVRRASRQDLQRRHQLLTVATGWGRANTVWTLALLASFEVVEFFVALAGRDTDRAGAIVGSWRWLAFHRARVLERRRQRRRARVLTDAHLRRLQVGGASRLKRFLVTLLREGLDRARGILPEPLVREDVDSTGEASVGFATAFSESEEFDEFSDDLELERHRPSRVLTSFRAQGTFILVVCILWAIGSRNLVTSHLPLIGRLAPLDSWWTMWRHFFASWSSGGVGSSAPGMPGYGVLGFAGTFVLGRMGLLARVALIGAVPLGAVGVARLLQGRVSNRARLVAAVSYLAMPLGLNMVSQGRIDVLVAVAGLPFVVRRTFELLSVPGFQRTWPAPVAFGAKGWRATVAGQRTVAAVLVALLGAMVPAVLVTVVVVALGVLVARLFEPDELDRPAGTWRTVGSIGWRVAVLLAPLTIDAVVSGARVLGVFGLPRGPWSSPSFAELVRGADGAFGLSWFGWLLPGAAIAGLLLCRGERRLVATKVATIGSLTLILATLDARHWMGSFAPELDVLLALVAVALAALIGLGVSATELDLRNAGFGWRQVTAGTMVAALVVGALPLVSSFASGRFDLPTTSVAESMNAPAPRAGGGYRVLWLGDPSVVPLAGWSVAPGLEAATSMNGLPGGASLFASPGAGAGQVLTSDVQLALDGRTVRLGQLLAQAGIATIVVMNTSAPELSGVQKVPVRAVPVNLVDALSRQVDLSLVLGTPSFDVFSNSLFHGIVSATSTSNGPGARALDGPLFGESAVVSGDRVVAALAPSDAFTLDVNGQLAPRSLAYGWAPSFLVTGPAATTLSARVVMHRFPLNAVIAALTLLAWLLVWLGLAGARRVELLFSRRRVRRARRARHAKGAHGA